MAQRLDIESYRHHFQEGSHLLHTGDNPQAEHHLRLSLQANPASCSAYLNLAAISYKTGRYQQSLGLCDLAIQCKPYSSESYYNRCLALMGFNNTKSISMAFRDVNCAISCRYLHLFKISGSVQCLQKSLTYSINNHEALLLLNLTQNNLSSLKQNQKRNCYKIRCPQILEQSKQLIIKEDNGIFRLQGKKLPLESLSSNQIKEQIYKNIELYLKLMNITPQHIHQEQMKNKHQPRLRLEQNVVQVMIQPTKTYSGHTSPSKIDGDDDFDGNSEVMENIFGQILLQPLSVSASNNSRCILQDISHKMINSHFESKKKCRNVSEYMMRSFNTQMAVSKLKVSQFCQHSSCLKCSSVRSQADQSLGAFKLQIKTVEIFRNQKYANPRPYLVIEEQGKIHQTEVDYKGSYFPNWNTPIYLQDPPQQNSNECKVELWNKDRKDICLGIGYFGYQIGRKKVDLKMEGKKIGYLFINIQNIR